MQDLVKQLANALSTIPDWLIATLKDSFNIDEIEDEEASRYYLEKELAETIILNEVVGVTLLRIRDELEDTEEAFAFKNALSDNLIIRMNRAAESVSNSSTYQCIYF